MAFPVLDMATVRANILRDIKNLLPDADVGEDSDYFVRATSIGSAVEGLYQHQQWIVRQIFPDSADTDFLELHCALRDIRRKSAVSASGLLGATGTAGKNVPVGLIVVLDDGRQYAVTTSALIGEDGTADIQVSAVVPGVAGNVAAGAAGTFQMAPAGIDSAVVMGDIVGGTERETDAALLARLLDLIRRPPAGGNKYDYKRWALGVSGVVGAYVYPLRRGNGTVDIAVTAEDGLPSEATIDAVQAHIDDVRPVTAKNSIVLAPDIMPVDYEVEVQLDGITPDAAQVAIEAALAGQFAQIEPGQGLVRSRSEALITAVSGIVDRRVVAPAANVSAIVNGDTVQWLRLGTVTVSLME